MAQVPEEWTVLSMMEWATDVFKENDVPEPRLSIEWLLSYTLGIKRLDLYLQFDRPLSAGEREKLRPLVTRRAQGLGMEVAAYDPYVSRHRAEDLRVELFDELHAMLARSDVLTVHTPLTDETLGMIGAAELAALPAGAIVVNAARGGIVDEEALHGALAGGHLFAAGLDVFRHEPPARDHPLLGRDDVVVTAHLGANTNEAQARIGAEILERVAHALRGDYASGVVNARACRGRHALERRNELSCGFTHRACRMLPGGRGRPQPAHSLGRS
jgi:D-3-phosphoglycerate dehydrogenase